MMFLRVVVLSLSLSMMQEAYAQVAEVSAASGGLQNKSEKFNSSGKGSEFQVSIGTRYAELMDDDTQWLLDLGLAIRNYSADSGFKSPGNSVSVSAGAGIRWFMADINNSLLPYLAVIGSYRTDRQGQVAAGSAIESEKNGLYYTGVFGMRIPLNPYVFVDFELDFFESALYSIEKNTDAAGNKTEVTRFELFGDTQANLTEFTVGLGAKI